MIYFGKVYNWDGVAYRINASAPSIEDAECIIAHWDLLPPPVLNWIYNKEIPKKWNYHNWKAKCQ